MIKTAIGVMKSAACLVGDILKGRPLKFRSPKWHTVEKRCVARDGGRCKWCGSTVKPQGHHKKPYHLNPEDELDPNNVITLCMDPINECHLRQGHRSNEHPYGNWKDFNPNIQKECDDKNFTQDSFKR